MVCEAETKTCRLSSSLKCRFWHELQSWKDPRIKIPLASPVVGQKMKGETERTGDVDNHQKGSVSTATRDTPWAIHSADFESNT